MRILHTADLHLGQIIYRHYDRADEHTQFFDQLNEIISSRRPDALVVSGDIFDVQQPSATSLNAFNTYFAEIRRRFPEMHIVIVAGNHDSPSRLQSHSPVWELSDVTLVGSQPPLNFEDVPGWEERFVVRLPQGYIIALPYMTGNRPEIGLALQDYVGRENTEGLPVVMTGHIAVCGSDTEGHDLDIGTLNAVALERLGSGFDYLALGHIHKPQTLGATDPGAEMRMTTTTHAAPVARYSGSVLHVSGDEAYPHSVSVVDIDRHGGTVAISRVRINQLRHFHILANADASPFMTEKEALAALGKFIGANDGAYVRLKVSTKADLSPEFASNVYTLIEDSGKDIRYNPKMLMVSPPDDEGAEEDTVAPVFEVSELQEMVNPLDFVRRTLDRYPGIGSIDLEAAFAEIDAEIRRMDEEKNEPKTAKNTKA